MNLNVYTIFDSAASAHMRPFFMQSDGQAIRSFSDLALDADHEVGKHPEDYSLCRIGTWNDQNAQLTPEHTEVLTTGLKVVSEARQVDRKRLEQLQLDVEAREAAQRHLEHHNDA